MHRILSFLVVTILLFANPSIADSERFDALQDQVAAWLDQATNGELAASLVEDGLARSDSERISYEFVHNVAGCIMSALKQHSEQRSLDFDKVLDGLESSLMHGNVESYFDSIGDSDFIESSIDHCINDAAQVSGIRLFQ